jgi:ferrous iron transport protein B
MGAEDDDHRLAARLQADRQPDGSPTYSFLTALSLLVFYAFACQCMSTVAVVARETRSWRWPVFMFAYMSVLAYVASLVVYQGGRLFGLA